MRSSAKNLVCAFSRLALGTATGVLVLLEIDDGIHDKALLSQLTVNVLVLLEIR